MHTLITTTPHHLAHNTSLCTFHAVHVSTLSMHVSRRPRESREIFPPQQQPLSPSGHRQYRGLCLFLILITTCHQTRLHSHNGGNSRPTQRRGPSRNTPERGGTHKAQNYYPHTNTVPSLAHPALVAHFDRLKPRLQCPPQRSLR